ncbi:MAG: ATP-binding protein [Pseudomonadota bacterium]|nr:ATP-binding protein [Pseudomonadota bacterium]
MKWLPTWLLLVMLLPLSAIAQTHTALSHADAIGRDILIFAAAISFALGTIFLLFWVLRRHDTAFGWYALTALFGSAYGYNQIAASPWPFDSNNAWQAFIGAMLACVFASCTLFLLRVSERRMPCFERAVLGVATLLVLLALAFPETIGANRGIWLLPLIGYSYLATLFYVGFAIKTGRRDQQLLALCVLAAALISIHDLLVLNGVIQSGVYLFALSLPIMLAGMASVLTYHFVNAASRVEGFNAELQSEVSRATEQLTASLGRQHALELAQGMAAERLQLVRDLHDGFGGMLIAAISELENGPVQPSRRKMVDLLRRMRDDLRLVIETTSQENADLLSLLAPLRRRSAHLLEADGIRVTWDIHDIESIKFNNVQSLDLLRLLQEALINVYKHSRATHVQIELTRIAEQLHLSITDDGVGMPGDDSSPVGGTGSASMRMRAARLGGNLTMPARAHGTEVRVQIPIPAATPTMADDKPA